jgi:3,4-dihydroxy 2-butanone 4-phosphate synthase / GTP cyclohydrolase II
MRVHGCHPALFIVPMTARTPANFCRGVVVQGRWLDPPLFIGAALIVATGIPFRHFSPPRPFKPSSIYEGERMSLCRVEEAVEDFKAGKFVIIVDDEDRENEGDLAIASQHVTPEAINFMSRHARGLICVPMDHRMVDRLRIPMMVPPNRNNSGFGTGFTISVEARHGVTTGISAFDRARTIQVLTDPGSRPNDLVMPGHIFPLRAQPGGVLARRGQTEAGVDLARLAGLTPSAVICEVMSADGSMARLPELEEVAQRHAIKIISVETLALYLRSLSPCADTPASLNAGIVRGGESVLPTEYGTFRTVAYRDLQHNEDHLVLSMGDLGGDPPLVRLHSACLTGDVLGSHRCDCGEQLQLALQRISRVQRGVLVYLKQEGRGIGLANKIRAYALQDLGHDTVDANLELGFSADDRTYEPAAAILRDLGITSLRLMTNNPGKVSALTRCGLQIVERVPHEIPPQADNINYLRTKAQRLNHMLGSVA